MWVAFFDESGHNDDAHSLCIAGYVATSGDWFELSRAWRAILAEYHLPHFHAVDLFSRRGCFSSWDPADTIPLLSSLIAVVNSTDVFGIAGGVVRSHYYRLRDSVPAPPDRALMWEHPYFLCFQHVVIETAIAGRDLPPQERIAFVFDNQPQFQGRAAPAFLQMRETGVWPRGFRLGSITFGHKTDYVPLQVADLLAWETRRHLDTKLVGGTRPMRKSFQRLIRRVIPPGYIEERTLQHLLSGDDDGA